MQDYHRLNEALNINKYEKIHCFEYLVTVITIIFGFKLLKMLKNTQRRQKNPCFL